MLGLDISSLLQSQTAEQLYSQSCLVDGVLVAQVDRKSICEERKREGDDGGGGGERKCVEVKQKRKWVN